MDSCRLTVALRNEEGILMCRIPIDANPLADVRVRRAISLALDREFLCSHAMLGEASPLASPVPEHFFGADTSLRGRCAVGTLLLVTGRPTVIALASSLGVPVIASIPNLMPCWMPRCSVSDRWMVRMNLGASLKTRFSAKRWKVFHGGGIFPSA